MKKILLSLLILSILIGCSPGSQGPPVDNFRTGNTGLVATFQNNMPPSNIRMGSDVYLVLDIWNRGAHTVEEGHIRIINLDSASFRKPTQFPEQTQFRVEGKGLGFSQGGRTLVNLGRIQAIDQTTNFQNPSTNIVLNICYPYQTIFTQQVCIDRNVFEIDPNQVCRNTPSQTFSGQGAPVIVSKLESNMLPRQTEIQNQDLNVANFDENGTFIGVTTQQETFERFLIQPSFDITVRNTGGGVVFTLDQQHSQLSNTQQKCTATTKRKLNHLKVSANLSDFPLRCTSPGRPEGLLILEGGVEGTITCTITPDSFKNFNTQGTGFEDTGLFFQDFLVIVNNYVDFLEVELNYMYETTASKTVNLIR